MTISIRRVGLAVVISVLATGTCWAGKQIVIDSNFDDLEIGTAPDNEMDAGPWTITCTPGVPVEFCEDFPDILSIVPTSSFDTGAEGNSLRVEWMNENTQTAHFFDEALFPEDADIVRASFDVYIPELSDGRRAAPFIWFGGNDEGPLEFPDRGPHLSWGVDGRLRVASNVSTIRTVVDSPPLDEWQRVQLDIDLANESYDMFWSTADGTAELVAPYLNFQGNAEFLDRIEIGTFPRTRPFHPNGVGYIDNVRVEAIDIDWIGDANLDGEFNSGDFVDVFQAGKYETGEVAAWSQGDWNRDRVFDSGDFVVAFQDGGYEKGPRMSTAAVPEPSSLLILTFGLLGVVRFHRIR